MSTYSSYITGLPTVENMQAITKAEVLMFSKDATEACPTRISTKVFRAKWLYKLYDLGTKMK